MNLKIKTEFEINRTFLSLSGDLSQNVAILWKSLISNFLFNIFFNIIGRRTVQMGHHYIPRDWFHYCFYWAVPEIVLCCCKMATQWEEMDGWCICWSWCWIYWSWGLYQYLVIFILFLDSFISCYFLSTNFLSAKCHFLRVLFIL